MVRREKSFFFSFEERSSGGGRGIFLVCVRGRGDGSVWQRGVFLSEGEDEERRRVSFGEGVARVWGTWFFFLGWECEEKESLFPFFFFFSGERGWNVFFCWGRGGGEGWGKKGFFF